MPTRPDIKVDKVVVYDSKLESAVKKTALSRGEKAASDALDEAYVIKLVPKLEFDDRKREIVGTCSWSIYEGGGSRLFAALKQTKQATGRATVNPAKITQTNLDDAIGDVVENEVKGISKMLKAMGGKKP
jgi:hypothetical protein